MCVGRVGVVYIYVCLGACVAACILEAEAKSQESVLSFCLVDYGTQTQFTEAGEMALG